MLGHLQAHLLPKTVILGIGNTLSKDDGAGSLLAGRIKDKVPYIVYDAGASPENYLGKIIKDRPDSVVIIDAADFGAKPGEFAVLEPEDFKPSNIFFTHNSSLVLVVDYLKTHITSEIIMLLIQPQDVSFGEELTSKVRESLSFLENWFYERAKEKR
jgi:hydrogenase 3 maturation protease